MKDARTLILRFAALLHLLGLFLVLAECPRIDGGLTFLSVLAILCICLISSFGIWIMSTSHAKRFRIAAVAGFAPSAIVTLLLANYYSPYLFIGSIVVVTLPFYN
jgi:hypothetical protein